MPRDSKLTVAYVDSGNATLTAGSVAVTFTTAFTAAPMVLITRSTTGTRVVDINPALVTSSGFTAISKEITGAVTGATLVTTDGTTATSSFNWLAVQIAPDQG